MKLPWVIVALSISSIQASSFLPSSFKARFIQEYVSTLKGEKRTSQGQLDYKYPGHIRFSVQGKQNIVFVSNTSKSWYYTPPFIDGEPGELIVGLPGKAGKRQNPYAKLFDIMAQGLKNNPYYTVSSNDKKGAGGMSSTLTFTQAGMLATQIKRTTIFFAGQRRFQKATRIDVTFADDRNFTLKLSSIKVNVDFKKGHFVFEAPPNTRQL